jgi:MscS family membrane protein
MVLEFLNAIYFGNPLMNWIYFFLVIIIFFIIAKTTNYIIKSHGRKITSKIKGNIDDKLLDMIEEPLAYILIIIGIYIGYFFLTFDANIDFYVYNILKVLGLIAGVWISIRLIDVLLGIFLKPIIGKTKTKFDDQIIQLLSKLLKVVVVLLALIIALDSFGIDVFTLVAGLGIGGLAFAFAAQKTIADAFGGLSILLSRPFVLGDFIEYNGVIGSVEEISLRHTRIRNLDKRIVTIPNGDLASSVVTNISSAPKRKVIWKLGVTYNTSIAKMEKAKKIITKAINSCKYCEKEPVVAFDEFADSSLTFFVMFFTKTSDWTDMVKAKDEIGMKIKKEFEKAKIEFAFPTQTIHLEK